MFPLLLLRPRLGRINVLLASRLFHVLPLVVLLFLTSFVSVIVILFLLFEALALLMALIHVFLIHIAISGNP